MIPVSSGLNSDNELIIDLTLDWLSFTYKSPKAPSDESIPYNHFADFCKEFPELQDFISKEGFTLARQRGWYDTVLQFCDSIRISYCNDRQSSNSNHLGVNVEIPSHGLSKIMGFFGFHEDDVVSFFNLLRSRHCKASRLDLAFDDFSKTFKPVDLIRFYIDNQISTRFRNVHLVTSSAGDGGTLYFGERSAGKMLRIYDKDFESKGEINSIRYEVELHSSHADDMLNYIADGREISFSSYICNFLRLVTRESVRHMSGCEIPAVLRSERSSLPTHPAWIEFLRKWQVLRTVKSVKVPHVRNSVSAERLKRWVKSISGSLRAFSDLVGFDFFEEIVAKARVPDKYILGIKELSDIYFEDRSRNIRRDRFSMR